MKTILLIEDDILICGLLKTLFELEGYKVLIEGEQDEEELLKIIFTKSPDLVFLDVHLKSINGLELAKKIRCQQKSQKIMISSGMFLEGEAIQAGADGFVLKPYMPGELLEKVKKLVE